MSWPSPGSRPEPASGPAQRILFITSNGTGLGHLTRSMAIARRLPDGLDPFVITLSAAAPVVREAGFPVEYIASHATPGAGSDWRWSRRLRGRLQAAIADLAPAVAMFDGAHPYLPLLDALRGLPSVRRVWCRRPMWRPGSNPGAIERASFFDAVLEPGEFAASEDRGATVARRHEAHVVDPIVFLDDSELLPRERAERELGIEPGGVNVLVQLGQGEEVRAATDRCLRHLAGREGVKVAALSSALARLESVPAGIVQLKATYPISRFYRAFDACVSAAGYNAYHELIRFGLPSLFVPMPRDTDDQAARVRFAAGSGVGLGISGPGAPELEGELDLLLDGRRRGALERALAERRPPNGAADAAAWLAGMAWSEPSRATSGDGGGSRIAREARRLAQAAPHLPRHGAAFVRQTATRRPPATVVLALGRPDAEALEVGLRDALARTPDPPARVLVITDSLALAPLRAAGVGVEHVPAADDAQAELAGGDYGVYLRRRIGLILAERRRPRRALSIGPVDSALLDAIAARPGGGRRA